MTSFPIGGQGTGDFRETSSRVQLFHIVTRNSMGSLSADSFTASTPAVVTTQASSTLSGITKKGLLGGTVVFTRPDAGNNLFGGPTAPGGVYQAGQKPLGLLLNDVAGNSFENAPALGSSKGPYACGNGSCVGVSVYESKVQLGGGAGSAITYANGDKLYASVNGLLTNVLADAYEYNVAGQNDIKYVTLIGIVKVAPDATSSLMVLDLRV